MKGNTTLPSACKDFQDSQGASDLLYFSYLVLKWRVLKQGSVFLRFSFRISFSLSFPFFFYEPPICHLVQQNVALLLLLFNFFYVFARLNQIKYSWCPLLSEVLP